MLSWLAPWVYLGAIGVWYFLVGPRRPNVRTWVRSYLNLWLAVTLALVVLGLAGELAYRWRWVAVGAWIVTILAVVITFVLSWQCNQEAPLSRLEDLAKEDSDPGV